MVTCEVVVVDAVVPSTVVVHLAIDATEEAVGEALHHPAKEVGGRIERLAPETNLTLASMDVILALTQDSQCPDDRDTRKGAYQGGRIEVMQYFRALAVVNCCCCPGCLDSE